MAGYTGDPFEWLVFAPVDAMGSYVSTTDGVKGILLSNAYIGAKDISDTTTALDLAFSASAGTVSSSIADSTGGTTAKRFVQNSAEATHYLYPNMPVGSTHLRFEGEFKPVGSSAWLWIELGGPKIYFNLATGVIGTITHDGSIAGRITPTTNGFFKVEVEGQCNPSGILVGSALADGVQYFTGNGATGFDWCNAKYRAAA